MENEVKDIQNTIWAMYKEFQISHDVKKYNTQAMGLCQKYAGQPILGCFCENLIVTWAPVINEMLKKYRSEV